MMLLGTVEIIAWRILVDTRQHQNSLSVNNNVIKIMNITSRSQTTVVSFIERELVLFVDERKIEG